jgi:O-antigen ligase
MTLRVAHIINVVFLTNLTLVILNAIMFMLFWRGLSLTIPIMAVFSIMALFLKYINGSYANISFQLWTAFTFVFIAISYPATLFYAEVHPSLDIPFLARSYLYNFIITFSCYQYTLFIIERGKTAWFLNVLNILLIIGSLLTIFAIPVGLYTLNYVKPPRFLSLTRMSGIYLDPNFAGFAANITAAFGLSSLFRPNASKLLGILGVVSGFGAVVASFSKTGILSLIVLIFITAIIYFVMYQRIDKQVRRVANIFFAILFHGIFQLLIFLSLNLETLPKEQRERIQQIENIILGKADKSDTSNRANLIELGLSKIAERPLLGTGYLSFIHLLDAGNKTGDNVGVHNIFLRVWGEAGILAFLLFTGFWLYTFWRGTQLPTIWARLLITSLVVSLVIFGLTMHTFLEDNFIGAIIGIMLAFLAGNSLEKRTPQYK